MEQFSTYASTHSSTTSTAGEAHKTRETNPPRFVEHESKDSAVRYWAAKAVQVLENPELSDKGRILIVRDIQERIAARLCELKANQPRAKKGFAAAKPAGLGCPKQIARLRESFKQLEAPKPSPGPVKKIHLAPRTSKDVSL